VWRPIATLVPGVASTTLKGMSKRSAKKPLHDSTKFDAMASKPDAEHTELDEAASQKQLLGGGDEDMDEPRFIFVKLPDSRLITVPFHRLSTVLCIATAPLLTKTPPCKPPLHETASCNRGQAQPTQPTVVCVPPTHCSRFELLTNAANSVQHSPRATATDNTKLKPDFSDDGAPATDAPKRRTKTTKNRSGVGWNGCNLYKNHMKHCWMKGDQALLDVHDYVKQHLSSAGTLYTPRKHRKSMCTVGCKPSTLDLSKGEGSNLNKTGAFLVDKWKNLSEEQRQIYNKEAQLIKVINESH